MDRMPANMLELRQHMKPLVHAALCECFKALFNNAEKELFQQAKRTGQEKERQQIFAALSHIKQERPRFEQQVLERIEQSVLAEALNGDWAELSGDRGVGLQVEDMLAAARARFGIEHAQYEARLEWMRQRDAEQVPDGLYTLAAITAASLIALKSYPPVARIAVIQSLGSHLLGKLEPLYVLLNDFLVQAGVLTRVRSIRPKGAAAGIDQFKSAMAHHPSVSEMPEIQNLGSEELRDRLDALTREAQDTVLMDQLDGWSSEQFLRSVQARVRDAGPGIRIEAMAQEIIKLVGILFSGILNDDKIATPVRRQILRLQWPVLRVALNDRTFFRQASHPARDVLNLSALIGSDPSTSNTTVQSLSRVIQQVIASTADETDTFARARDDLKQLERAADTLWIDEDRRAAQARHEAMIARCRERVKATIETQSAGINLLPETKRFLREVWGPLMVMVLLNYGRQSQAWTEAMRLLDRALALQSDPDIGRRDVLAFGTQAKESLELAQMLPEAPGNPLDELLAMLEQRVRANEEAQQRGHERERARKNTDLQAGEAARPAPMPTAAVDQPQDDAPVALGEPTGEFPTGPAIHQVANQADRPDVAEPPAVEQADAVVAAPPTEDSAETTDSPIDIVPLADAPAARTPPEEPVAEEPVLEESVADESEAAAEAPKEAQTLGQLAVNRHEAQVVTFIETHVLNDDWFEVFTAEGAALRRLKGKSINTELGVVNFANRMGELALFIPLVQMVDDLVEERTRPVFENPAFTRALGQFRLRIQADPSNQEDGQDD